ncbi:TlpA family protein disulfide reductase [Prevotella sp. OH937_COT-195]|uniref:TlpA family protein disulfide reductase n=1 Tax=Prevotella sp. OH937_COT-195 TaxID=2491051 RepID=UPI000F650528|nr:TlpA disulfide reductase family protein [Prevotella sp. OH937_COT-195]RRC99116.1 TlpA family protein disulfide reductase [Prevotella sp. OH937_COT-195]
MMKNSKTLLIFMAFISLVFAIGSCNTSTNKSEKESQTGSKEDSVLTEDNNNEVDKKVAIDFKLNDIEGKNVSLMSEVSKNKLTILDFWASWCRPCMEEMPNMINIYDKYGNKGLGIVGVSLDDSEQDWKGTVKSKGLKWTQLSDLKGWESPVAQKYNVQSIPYILVIDQKGNIIAEDIRGTELEEFVATNIE